MTFSVHFATGSSTVYKAVRRRSTEIGLDGLDLVRELLETPGLEAGRVSPESTYISENPKIEISESLARESGLFEDRCTAEVRAGNKQLNEFLRPVVDAERDETTGEIISAELGYELDREAAVQHWQEEGFPTSLREDA